MKIATTVDALIEWLPLKDALEKIKSHGYDAIDYDCAKSFYKPDGGVYSMSDKEFIDFFKKEKMTIHSSSILVSQLHSPYPTYNPSMTSEEYAHRVESIRRTLYASEILESPYLVLHGAQRKGWDPDDDPEATKQMNLELFDKLLPTAEKTGVKLALENLPYDGVYSSSPDDIIDCIDTINSDYLVACLDTGHSNMTSVKPPEFARKLGRRLKVLHVHDNRGNDDSHLTPYCGNIRWNDFAAALREIGYDGVFSFESDLMIRKFPDALCDNILDLEYKVGKHITSLI